MRSGGTRRIVMSVQGTQPTRAAIGSLTLLLVVALTLQLAPMVANAGSSARVHEQVRFAEPLRLMVGVPAKRQGEKPDKIVAFARRDIVPVRAWRVLAAIVPAADVGRASHLDLELLVSLPPPAV
jgi:hypothetical protein